MRSMLSVDEDYELSCAIGQLRTCLKRDTVVPLEVYSTLEDYGVLIGDLINKIDREIKETHGESNFYDPYWGC